MYIKSVILENFRAYKDRTVIPFTDLTAFIGKNDAGKSTILEALDIFFEGGVKKIESDDASKTGDAKAVRIGVVFDRLPEEIILDTNVTTTFENEYLLNSEKDLEIHKTYNCSLSSPKVTISACAVHPEAADVANLLQKSNKELKAIIKERNLQGKCNQTENPSMRLAIYQDHSDLQLQLREVPLNDANGKAVWAAIQNYLPIFALFQSDRPSTDQDSEVQDPMKLAVKQALMQLESELDSIAEQVSEKARETARATVAKLQSSYPNLTSLLEPKFTKPKWDSIFKLGLEADDGIPLNKRGSGVRRLILMSFFQAQAERKKAELGHTRPLVYAIEEPETSQHPDNQNRIIETFKALADAGDQVILTTHVPGLAGLISLDCLRYVDRDPETQAIRVRGGSPEVYGDIADALGVLPVPSNRTGVKVAVLVEGKHDIDALRSMAMVLSASNYIAPLAEDSIFWTIGGGSALKDWVERRYLDRLGLPQVIIQDSDRSNSAMPLDEKKQKWLSDTNAMHDKEAFVTNKRNMDNYLHPDAVCRLTEGKVQFPPNSDIDYERMAPSSNATGLFAELLSDAIKNKGLKKFHPIALDGTPISPRKENAKHIIAAYIIRNMTADQVKERGAYKDPTGTGQNEILEWLRAIQKHLT
ncbi:MAG: ATP-binding protein [bacterium]|nr:ATP-binding protein [bacterium]